MPTRTQPFMAVVQLDNPWADAAPACPSTQLTEALPGPFALRVAK